MENYFDLGIRYIKHNKRRNILTACGVMAAVTVLYIILNLSWSYLLNYRSELRKTQDYEIVLFTENQEQIDEILKDKRVKSATVGRYYSYDYEPVDYENATYINTVNPYRLIKMLDGLKSDYNVDGIYNKALAITYFQDSNGSIGYIIILVVILISYIAAIFGVGLIRSSIQFTIYEHIKDFGNLRCIGSTKGQLKAIIYMQGAIVELAGIVFGIIFGWIGSLIAGAMLGWKGTGFHLAPVPFIVFAFAFDMVFVMEENAKLVTKMTPVSAIRGEYRIRKEKLKRRKSGLWGIIFGLEGDYAYKNVRRNSGRFARTIAAMSLGIAGAIFVFGIVNSMVAVIKDMNKMFGYYNIYFQSQVDPKDSKETMMKELPPTELLSQVSALSGLSEAKKMYENGVLVADFDDYIAHFTKDSMKKSMQGRNMDIYNKYEQEIKSGGKSDKNVGFVQMYMYGIQCFGYDKKDMERFSDALIDGTLDVSDNGVIIVNGSYSMFPDDDDIRGYFDYLEYSNYKVGDKIEFVDTAVFRQRYNEKLKLITDEYEADKKELQAQYDSFKQERLSDEEQKEKDRLGDDIETIDSKYQTDTWNLVCSVYKDMIDEGHTKTYTIEGIVKENVNYGTSALQMSIILPLDKYYKLTGTDESWANGMMYHFDRLPLEQFSVVLSDDEGYTDYVTSGYYEYVSMINSFRNVIVGIGTVIFFVVLINIFNIVNTTASDLYLRRKELAQLRVLGISKKGLYKMVVLEGVIATIISSIIGIVIGTGLGYCLYEMVIGTLFLYHYRFPILAAILSVVITAAILCGSVYFPLKRMGNDVAEDLATAGE